MTDNNKKDNMFQLDEDNNSFRANIKVIGVGGGGGNAIKTMCQSGLSGVEFIAANTDLQALEELDVNTKIQLGEELTKGLGAGANPEIGRQSAIESCDAIVEAVQSTDMVFITAGMGGGTGTGAAGVIANIAKQQGALTVGVVTRPFFFEGRRRARNAEMGIQFLNEHVDTLIVIPNQKLLKTVEEHTSLLSAFKSVDDILLQAVKGIADLVNEKGLINLDFADVKTIMSEKGLALIGTGTAEGDKRALVAGHQAVSSPLLEDISFKGAMGIIINITGGSDLSLIEVNQAAELITAESHPDAEIVFGAVVDPNETSGRIRVTVIATGFDAPSTPITSSIPSSSSKKSTNSSVTESSPIITSSTSSHTTSDTIHKSTKSPQLEQPKVYKDHTNEEPANTTSISSPPQQQLSMSIPKQKEEFIASSANLPFEDTKDKMSLMDFFKK